MILVELAVGLMFLTMAIYMIAPLLVAGYAIYQGHEKGFTVTQNGNTIKIESVEVDMIEVGGSDDYAYASYGNVEYYYGYETEINDEWCFTETVNGKRIRQISFSALKNLQKDLDMFECQECLMIGIMYSLQEKENGSN